YLAPRALAALLAFGLFVPVSRSVLSARPSSSQLGGTERFSTFVSTDKPIYRAGETVYARGVMLHALKRTPLNDAVAAMVEVRGPKGDVLANVNAQTENGVWAFSWPVPEGSSGGEYTLKVRYPWAGHAPAERKFDVRVFRAPRLKSQITFLRDGYGPGDTVTATLDVKRAEGGIPSGAKVTATAQVDGAEVARIESKVDDKGLCTVRFPLPKEIGRGEGAVAFAIEDGGVVETAAKTLPILLQTLDLALFPEGGDLVAGLPARVYFEARTPAKKPADLAGVVVNRANGQVVAKFRSEHEGRGRFELTPEAGVAYELRVTEPTGIKARFPLPEAKARGAVLRGTKDVTTKGRLVELGVDFAGLNRVMVTLSKREMSVASSYVSEKKGTVVLDPGDADGVLVATVWDDDGRPLAERLVFREPEKTLQVELRPDRKTYVPGDAVKLSVRTLRDGKPVSAVVGLTVTDDAVLELIEKREQAPQLPVMVLLESEVRELADAQVYLDPKHPKSKLAVDLLLGTQGWRRFAYTQVPEFLSRYGDEGRRVLAYATPPPPQPIVRRVPQRATRGTAKQSMVREEAMPADIPMAADRGAMEPEMEMAPMADLAPAEPPMEMAPPPPVQAAPHPAQEPMAGPVVDADKLGMAKDDFFGGGMGMKKKEAMPNRMRRDRRIMMPEPISYVREYAHALLPGRKAGDRTDFTETLYWHAGIRTDDKGEATVRFALNDSVTTFKAFANAFNADGALGSTVAELESVQPFYVEAKLPLEVTSGDVVRVPLALVNGTGSVLRDANVRVSAKGDLQISDVPGMELQAAQRARRMLELRIGQRAQSIDVQLAAKAGDFADTVTRKLVVKPSGFPMQLAYGGLLGPSRPAVHTVTLPAQIAKGSLRAQVAVYPTPLANMTESLAALIQQPGGCFEQTSSTTYPMTMAQQYFLSHTGVDPKLVASAREKLDYGYKRLTGFETSERGYEWFGENPGHEALTAYGLLHFTDMKEVRDVDAAMLDRTRAWLLKQRDGKGGFERKRRALHTWIEDRDTSNAYILWALLEAGEREVGPEVAALKATAEKSGNSYVVALAANALALAKEPQAARTLMDKLAAKQNGNGVVEGGTQSIVGSGGEALQIETTALAVLAWLRDPAYRPNVERSMKFLADSCKGGRYGSTQSTVLALRAVVAYDKMNAKPKGDGTLRVFVDGQAVGAPVRFSKDDQGALRLPDISEKLTAGTRKIELRMEGGGAEMPYAIAIDYNALTPASSKESPVAVNVALNRNEVSEGDLVQARALVSNKTGQQLPTVVAIVGLPGGLEPRHDQLKELVKKGTIDAYEVMGRDVVLYWRGMEPNGRVEVPLSLVAAVPGTYTGAASRAYLYYTDEHKTWVDGLRVSIVPKA
ncbi:MAG TPA: MG2 domain-containing protein, partial [Myxococcaceae bacterium]|nr:MG2 domain-containing protein [Myxococcaceae bacterium]